MGILYRWLVYGYSENVRDNPTAVVKRECLHETVRGSKDWRGWVLGLKGCAMGFALGYLTMMTACRETQTRHSI